MGQKSKHSFYLDDDLYANFSALATERKISRGHMFQILYDQFLHDTLSQEHTKNKTAAQLKSLQKQIDALNDQSTMLIQLANTLGVKFNFQQLINTNINESGMVTEARSFVVAERKRLILERQIKRNEILNN